MTEEAVAPVEPGRGVTDATSADGAAGGYVLEQAVPLSRSRLWELQRAFYVRQGLGAWGAGPVPHHITSNPRIAAAYAEVIVAFLRDCDAAGRLDRSQRFFVLELGSGSGRFGYLLLRRLRRLLAATSLRDLPLTVVLTDFDVAKLGQLAVHPTLQADLAEGWLDLATVDAAAPGEVRTWRTGEVLEGQPLVVIANYVFDSVPADAFFLQGGVAHEARLSLHAAAPDVDLDDPGALELLSFVWDAATGAAPSTGNLDIDAVIARYAEVLGSTVVLLPTAAIACLEQLADAASAPVLALVADKGWAQGRELFGQGWPGIVPHGGCFSLMVDFNAIAQVVRARGGTAMVPAHGAQHLVVGAFVLGDVHPAETSVRYADQLAEGGPDDIYTARTGTGPVGERLTLEQALSMLRIARFDTQVFFELFGPLRELAPEAAGPVKADLALAVQRVYEDWFPIGEAVDVALCLGQVLADIDHHRKALELFAASLQGRGPHPDVHLAAARSHHALGDLDAAMQEVHDALALAPGLEGARALAAEIETARQYL
ncbi:MAG: tetratricopeptide repeat protein [Actinomycetota bacterium]|nr:tetratricopeptide repeat protein [Actinomycetota bacterium]